jgi:putative transposase
MARPLRFERVGGRYHVTARGNERKDLFRDDSDRFHF